MTQDQVAERFDINKATVSAWETGRGVPDALRLRALAKLYDVSADSLLWEDSLSPDAMKFAADFDSLNETQKRTLYAIWEAYIRESATDAEVEDRMAVTKTLKPTKYTSKVTDLFHPAERKESEAESKGD